jgi:hypothetical protein
VLIFYPVGTVLTGAQRTGKQLEYSGGGHSVLVFWLRCYCIFSQIQEFMSCNGIIYIKTHCTDQFRIRPCQDLGECKRFSFIKYAFKTP